MTRVGIYTRLSRDRQGTKTATKRQQRDCRNHADEHGWSAVAVYPDDDRSAYKLDAQRPEYERLLADLQSDSLDVLLVWRYDRLSRDPTSFARLEAACIAHDVRAVSVMEHVDWRNPRRAWNEIRGRINAAEEESITKGERLVRAHQELAEEGKPSGGGRRPIGFEGDKVTIRESEASVIRDARDIVFTGGGLGDVVRLFEKHGIRTVTGRPWHKTTIRRLLISRRICGQREHRGKVHPAAWPAIISPEDGEQLRAILTDSDRSRFGGVAARSYLLSGFVACGRPECLERGVMMKAHPSTTRRGTKVYRYRRYTCMKSALGCDRNGISAARLDELIEEMVLQHMEDPKILRALHASQDSGELARLRGAIVEAEKRQKQIAEDHHIHRVLDREEFLRLKRMVDDELRKLRKARDRMRSQLTLASLPEDTSKVRADWKDRGLDGKRALIGALLERIVIAPIAHGSRFDPSRIDPGWRHRPASS